MNQLLCSAVFPTVAIVAAIAAAAAPAHAEGLYAGASIAGSGSSHIEQPNGGTPTRYDAQREQTQLRVFGGYELDAHWGVEAGFRGFGGDTTFDLKDSGQLKTHTRSFYTAVKGSWQLNQNWSLFSKVGMAASRFGLELNAGGHTSSAATSKNGAYLSAGASYLLTKDVAMQVELEHINKLRYEGLEAGMSRLSLGLRYNF